MKPPVDYQGPDGVAVPSGYIDVTCLRDKGRRGIPGPSHVYYQMRNKMAAVISREMGLPEESERGRQIADKVMDAL